MKKILSILFVIITASGSIMAIDNPKTPATGMAVVKSKSGFTLFYKASKPQDVTVTIYNAEGNTVFTEKIKHHDSFVRPYNMKTLANGEYTVQIADADGKLLQKVSYGMDDKSLVVDLIRLKNTDKYVLRVPKQGFTSLTVKIFNSQNELVYRSEEGVSEDFAKLYELKKLGGDFRFEVKDDAGRVQSIAE